MGYMISRSSELRNKKFGEKPKRFRAEGVLHNNGIKRASYYDMKKWAKENCKGGYCYERVIITVGIGASIPFLFVHEDDALFFKLRFG